MSTEPERTISRPGPTTSGEPETVIDRQMRNPFYRYLMHLGLPLSLSLFVHVGILVFLGLKTFDIVTQRRFDVGEYEASLTESLADQMKDAFQWADANVLETPEEMPADQSLDSLLDVTAFDASELDVQDLGSSLGDDSGLGIGDGALTLIGTGGGAGEAGTGGFGSGLGGGGARIGRAGIWDLTIRANKIAYVVDFSGSIIVAVDDLKRELKRSIGRLKPSQSFNVIIFYSTGAGQDERIRTESFKGKLEPATTDARRAFFRWIDRKAPQGQTHPLAAVKRALALNPEAVFFFSDGFFDDSVVDEIQRANRRARARIYCLVFDEMLLAVTSDLPPRETEGSRRLRKIAEANRGKLKIVTGKDLARR